MVCGAMIVLYHDDEPQGRAFDQDAAEQALRVGWYEKEEAIDTDMDPDKPPEEVKINELSVSKRPRAGRVTTTKRGKPKRNASSG